MMPEAVIKTVEQNDKKTEWLPAINPRSLKRSKIIQSQPQQ